MTAIPRVDLHAHTTASDGTLPPAELVRVAIEQGLDVLGVTDHDSTGGLADALAAAAGTGLRLVPGVELSTDVSGGEVHVLGFYVPFGPGPFQDKLTALRVGRAERARLIVDRLAAAGAPIDLDRVLEIADGGAIGRPHVAQALIEAGHATSVSDAFDRFLSVGRPGYAPRQRFTPREAVELIAAAGGVPVLAHPVFFAREADRGEALVAAARTAAELIPVGLRGLEVYYHGYDQATVAALEHLAARNNLIPTVGSDYHGPGRSHGELGSVYAPEAVRRDVVARLEAARQRPAA